MNDLTIIKQNGRAYVDSRDVAEAIGKEHRHLLRDIRGYAAVINKAGAPNLGLTNFFINSTYIDAWNREKPCFLLSKMGCEVVANKLTGEKGILFTAAYVAKFNEMEAVERAAEIKSYAKPRLSEFNSAVRNVLSGMSYSLTKPGRVMSFLRGVYEPLGIKVQNERDNAHYFSATVIAKCLGIYSETGRPHGHAVSAIISKLENWPRYAIAIPYGLVGMMIRYNWKVVEKVVGWIKENNKPHDIAYLDFSYHIYYDTRLSPFFDDAGEDFIDLDGAGDYCNAEE